MTVKLELVPKASLQLKGVLGFKGEEGNEGPPNTLSIGTVTTGDAGTPADATISGTSPNQSLSLVIPKGDKGDKGDTGDQGGTGQYGGAVTAPYNFSTDTTTASIAVGQIRVNNADPSLATAIYASTTTADNQIYQTVLATLDDSTSAIKGHIRLVSQTGNAWRIYAVTGAVTTVGAGRQIVVTNVSGSGTFSEGESVLMAFSRTGDKGEQGDPASVQIGVTAGQYREISGAIRQTTAGGGWALIDDSGHEPLNIASVSQSSTGITLTYGVTGVEVVSFVCGPDETYAGYGITCGASVGTSSAVIQLAAPLTGMVSHSSSGTTVAAPAWWGTSITVAVSGDAITVTHPAVADANDVPVIDSTRSGAVSGGSLSSAATVQGGAAVRSGGYLAGSFVINTYELATVLIAYNTGTTNFDVTKSHGMTVSAAWDATAGNERLVVTHSYIDVPNNVVVVPDGGGSNCRQSTSSTPNTVTDVIFVTAAGARVTAPSASTRCKAMFGAYFRTASPRYGLYTFRRGHAIVNPNNLYSASGNIWFRGLIKVA